MLREAVDSEEFLELACRALDIPMQSLASSRKDREITRLRLLVASVGIERWHQRAGLLGPLVGRHPDMVSRWVRVAADQKHDHPAFSELTIKSIARFSTSHHRGGQWNDPEGRSSGASDLPRCGKEKKE
jgi:hypothetical protein